MPDLAEMLGLRRRNPLVDYGEGDGLETFGSDINGLDGQLDDQMPRQMPPPLMAQQRLRRPPLGGGPPTPLPERTTPQEPMSVLPPRMEAPPQPPSALPPPVERDAPIQESQATQVDFPSRPSLPPPVGQPSPNANPVNRSVVTDLMNTPPEYQPPKPPSVKRQILGTVLGMTPARAFAPLATYGPKGLQQMQASQAWQSSLPSRVEAAKLALEEQKLNKSTQQQPHTVTTEQGIMQFNPDTQRFDIPVGSPPPKEEMMGKTVTTDQGIMMWDPKTKSYGLKVGDAPEKSSAEKIVQSEDGTYLRIGADNTAKVVTVDGKPLKGKVTEKVPDDKEKFVLQYFKENKLEDSATNRAKALKAYSTASQAPQQAPQAMFMAPDGKGGFTAQVVRPGQSIAPGAVTPTGVNTQNTDTAATRTMSEAAPKVVSMVDRVAALVDKQAKDLGPMASRWQEFMAGKVGAPNPEFTKLRTDVGLLQTMLMRMHVGARGGQEMMKHFQDLIDTSKQSPQNLKAALGEIKEYANEVAKHGAGNPGGGAGGVVKWGRGANGNPIPLNQ